MRERGLKRYRDKYGEVEKYRDRESNQMGILCNLQEWDPSLPGLAVCDRSEREVSDWMEVTCGP